MKFLIVLFCAAALTGCAVEEQLSSKTAAKDVTLIKLSIRQIDSITAEQNYSFSFRNRIDSLIIKYN